MLEQQESKFQSTQRLSSRAARKSYQQAKQTYDATASPPSHTPTRKQVPWRYVDPCTPETAAVTDTVSWPKDVESRPSVYAHSPAASLFAVTAANTLVYGRSAISTLSATATLPSASGTGRMATPENVESALQEAADSISGGGSALFSSTGGNDNTHRPTVATAPFGASFRGSSASHRFATTASSAASSSSSPVRVRVQTAVVALDDGGNTPVDVFPVTIELSPRRSWMAPSPPDVVKEDVSLMMLKQAQKNVRNSHHGGRVRVAATINRDALAAALDLTAVPTSGTGEYEWQQQHQRPAMSPIDFE